MNFHCKLSGKSDGSHLSLYWFESWENYNWGERLKAFGHPGGADFQYMMQWVLKIEIPLSPYSTSVLSPKDNNNLK